MVRSKWKMPFIYNKMLKNLQFSSELNLWSKNSVIMPGQIVDKNIKVYNGKTFIKIKLIDKMVGHKYGEFVLTRKFTKYHSKKKKKKK